MPAVGHRILANEELTRTLGRQLRTLATHYRGGPDGRIPDTPAPLFAAGATATGMTAPAVLDSPVRSGTVRALNWTVTDLQSTPDAALRAFLDRLTRLDSARFEIDFEHFPDVITSYVHHPISCWLRDPSRLNPLTQ